MPSHPRVEEVEDSDVDMSDPSEGDIDDFDEADILRTRQPQQQQQLSRQAPPPTAAAPTHQHQHQHQPPIQQPHGYPEMMPTTDDSAYRAYQCLYPVYFDARRSRAEGRRVPKSLAVLNPLATEIVNACAALRLPTVLEAGRLHPKDWANPGRVKVALKEQHAAQPAVMKARVKNKHHLYVLVAQHLRANPTTDGSAALRVVVRGAPPPPHDGEGDKWPRPAVPRGWKMNDLLPYYSPAMTGGGVSENFLKDMMKEMGSAGGPGGADMASLLAAAAGGGGGGGGSGGASSSKKEKKGKGK
ncbi:signal recognition particle, Sec65/Srp19 subunit [Lasiosphaeria ovina]|uniref:Signal recognition particle, Sec65/Srp19 subunit n=1 Tax=Lasiosphaeria ovina TaxID=92902 RepID=A0AAE0K7Z7_9PEZI|nr:signal recognition particle, Sec65/Srp19 subunit [Lasiosphaeria ovina]